MMILVELALVVIVGRMAVVGLSAALSAARRALDERRMRASVCDDLPAIADHVARSLAVGLSLSAAVRDAVDAVPCPAARPLADVLAETDRGLGLHHAVRRLTERTTHEELVVFTTAMSVALGPVGPQPALFDRVAANLRSRAAARADALTQASQARASAVVVGAMPWVVCLVVLAGGGPVADRLFGTPLGLSSLAAAVVLELVGFSWMLVLTRSATR